MTGPLGAPALGEQQAHLSRATCGWQRSDLDLEEVWRYWRDVHSPAIARRAGILAYRQLQWSPVHAGFLGDVAGIETAAPPDAQLRWTSDILYPDEASLQAFYHSPSSQELMSKILGDIDLIVDRSTTYVTRAADMATLRDELGPLRMQGAPSGPHYGLFFRSGPDHDRFRATVTRLAARWSQVPSVVRLRYNLYEVPDMEADRRAGYPVKTHPLEQQYQAMIEVAASDEGLGPHLLDPSDDLGAIRAIHAYPVAAVYTFVWDHRPTLVGLRGYPAHRAIVALGATHATDPGLLEWMYGPPPSPSSTAGAPVPIGRTEEQP